jgi:endonuclease/exonuclease/phosphatase family metal-dependent hydrolase
MKLKVISWNIWGGRRLDEVISFLSHEDPDIIALQEVSERDVHGKIKNDAHVIAEALGYYVFFGKAFTTDRHTPPYSLGNAVISRFPILESRTFELSGLPLYRNNSITEPRNTVVSRIAVESQELCIL